MEQVVPGVALFTLLYPEGRSGRPPFLRATTLRIDFIQLRFSLLDPAVEDVFFVTLRYCEFAQLDELTRLPDESTILRFDKRLEKRKLAEQILATVNELLTQRGLVVKAGITVHATLIALPTSSKNKTEGRDLDIHSSKKGNQWYFGMKAHIEIHADSGLVHGVRGPSGYVSDVVEEGTWRREQETAGFDDAGHQGIEMCFDSKTGYQACWLATGRATCAQQRKRGRCHIERAAKL